MVKVFFGGTELARDSREERKPQTTSERSRTKIRCGPGSAKLLGFLCRSIEGSALVQEVWRWKMFGTKYVEDEMRIKPFRSYV
jgi:hypothetical protein